ncbi:MAG: aminotransferase class IV [Chlamydiota bacterium]
MYFFLNGSFLSEQDAKLSILDLGLIRGFGVFDYLRTYQGKPFHLEEHLQRLQYSAKNIGLSLPYSFDEMQKILEKLIEQNGPGEYSIKLIVTGGVSPDQLLPSGNTSFIAFAYPLTPYPPKHFTHGIKTITTSHKRCLPECKTTQYLPAIISLQEGRKKGALESLYISDKQEILEATTSNFFAFKKGVLITPPKEGILLGITREVVLRVCESHFPIEIRAISKEEIPHLDETFITASNKEVMPVIQIDDHLIRTGEVGPLTQKVIELFSNYTSSGKWESLTISRYL